MAQGRGSAKPAVVFGLAILCICALTKPVVGAYFNVGGAGGWTFNVNNWPEDKSFEAGDVLVFNYGSTIHNVVRVNKDGYDNCISSTGAKIYQSGKDRIKLSKGQNYFICTITGHCQSGMKIVVDAA